jgi:hypothetical protein
MRQMPPSLMERMKQAAGKLAQESSWTPILERLKGRTSDNGFERISTQHVFHALGVPVARRVLSAQKQLAMEMRALGWSPTRLRVYNRGSGHRQLRGFARPPERKPLRGADGQPRSKPPAEDPQKHVAMARLRRTPAHEILAAQLVDVVDDTAHQGFAGRARRRCIP